MAKKYLDINETEELNVFQSFTDLMSNAFMILSFFLLLAFFHVLNLNQRLQSASPIVIQENSGNFKFSSGSAELTPELKQYIATEVSPAIDKILQERDIDFIQVIGHTDGQENNQLSNLDRQLEKVANGNQLVSILRPGSNVDLGLMRALAVIQELEKNVNLKNIKFRAYSAAQLYLPSGKLAPLNRKSDETRRRIEIRFIPPGKKQ
jgi:outer membrane protein OmpA-like peptidoglycan-associated protein